MNNYLPQNIKYLRKTMGVKQSELADAIGKNFSTISNYESGYRNPPTEDLRAIANFFHVSTERLLNEDLSYVTDLDATLKADWIREELLRLRLSDKEFDMVENYIQFIVSQRSKNAGL